MNDREMKALRLLANKPRARDLTLAGHLVINAGVPGLLREGLIAYSKRHAYVLTSKGRKALA